MHVTARGYIMHPFMPTDNERIEVTTLPAGSVVNMTFHVAYPHRVSHLLRYKSCMGITHSMTSGFMSLHAERS